MLVHTFFWKNKPFDLLLINTTPESCDHSGYSLFALDGFQLMVCLDILDQHTLAVAVDNFRRFGEPLPRDIVKQFFYSFCREDIIVESEAPLDHPLVTFDGMAKLGDVVPDCEAHDWEVLLFRVSAYMRQATSLIKNNIEDKSFTAEVEDEDGHKERHIVTPSLSVRSQALAMQKNMFACCLKNKVSKYEGITPEYTKNNQSQFLNEKTLAEALTKLGHGSWNCATVRKLLIQAGFLEIVKRNNQVYQISKKGQGYGISGYGRSRLWHISIIKLLESHAGC